MLLSDQSSRLFVDNNQDGAVIFGFRLIGYLYYNDENIASINKSAIGQYRSVAGILNPYISGVLVVGPSAYVVGPNDVNPIHPFLLLLRFALAPLGVKRPHQILSVLKPPK